MKPDWRLEGWFLPGCALSFYLKLEAPVWTTAGGGVVVERFCFFSLLFFGGWGASVLNLALNYVDDLVFWLEIWVFERTTQLGRKGAPGRVKPTIRLPSSSKDRVGAGEGGSHMPLCGPGGGRGSRYSTFRLF